jgi:Bacterial regulatory helix-turn-helix protein, lysR family
VHRHWYVARASRNGAGDEIAHHWRRLSSPVGESKAGRWRLASNLPVNNACHAQLHHRRWNERYAEFRGHEIHDRCNVWRDLADDGLEASFPTGVDNRVIERRSDFPRKQQLSKATVSKAISRIEKKFGTRLFNRTARRLAVTEAGRQLYDRAAHILAEGEAAEDEVIAQSTVPRGRVRLTAPISCDSLDVANRNFQIRFGPKAS